ncbi:MAG: PDZ domain-containing protein [Gemmatimonadota bacterium]|nr:PDZ domain-containing protein [Gemmatimonadota bacterium]
MSRFPVSILATALLAGAAPLAAQTQAPPPPDPPDPPEKRVEVIVAPAPQAPRPIRFGFVLEPVVPPKVVRVLPGTPVDLAGVESGDVLVRIAGQTATVERVQELARTTAPGDTVEVVLRRRGEERSLVVIPETGARLVVVDPDSIRERARFLVEKARQGIRHWSPESLAFEIDSMVRLKRLGPESFAWSMSHRGSRLGLRLAEMNEGLVDYFPGVEQGLLVLEVVGDSPAAEAGVAAGDVIVEVNGREVWNVESFHAAREEGDTTLSVVRRGERHEIRVPSATR